MTYIPIHIKNLSLIQDAILKMIEVPEYNNATLFYLKNSEKLVTDIDLLSDALANIGLLSEIRSVAVIAVNPKTRIPIHKDTGNFTYSLNIPLRGYQKTFVNFYKTNAPDNIVEVNREKDDSTNHTSGRSYNMFDSKDCELLSTHESNTPYILNTQVPHDVDNQSDSVRLFLLIRLQESANEKICDNLVQGVGFEP